MSFGWAPSEELKCYKNDEKKGDFFTRLEADRRSSQCFQPRYRPRRKHIPNLRDIITHELERLMIVLPQGTGNVETFLHGDLEVLFSIRECVQRCLLKAIERTINSGVTTSTAPPDHVRLGYQKISRCLILEAGRYRTEIICCRTPQEFYDQLKITFFDIRRTISRKAACKGWISAVFLLTWIDFLRADFHSFNIHLEGVITLLQWYHNSLNGKPFPPVVNYVARVSCMIASCIGFYGDKQRFPDELIPQDHTWIETFLHPDEIPLVIVEFNRSEWMRTISNFRRWASTQRAAAVFEDTFVEEAIARQGDVIASGIINWANRTIPTHIETPSITQRKDDAAQGYNWSSSCFERHIGSPFDPHQFLNFPKVHFQSAAHNEMTMIYLGLLLLVSYSAYPQSGHLPFSRWELAVKFCQCFAAVPNHEEMGMVNRIFHLFYARITFDESFPKEREWCDHHWAMLKASPKYRSSEVLGCTIFMEREWGLVE